MNDDDRALWRPTRSGTGDEPFVLWRVVAGVSEYYRTAPCNYGPRGRIIAYSLPGAERKARELNAREQNQ